MLKNQKIANELGLISFMVIMINHRRKPFLNIAKLNVILSEFS